jgi:hypothetical protein
MGSQVLALQPVRPEPAAAQTDLRAQKGLGALIEQEQPASVAVPELAAKVAALVVPVVVQILQAQRQLSS